MDKGWCDFILFTLFNLEDCSFILKLTEIFDYSFFCHYLVKIDFKNINEVKLLNRSKYYTGRLKKRTLPKKLKITIYHTIKRFEKQENVE
jgi:hypothetical protein